MGRVIKKFTVARKGEEAEGRACIDSAADRTIISRAVACKLDIDFETAKLAAVSGVGGRLVGYEVPVTIDVGEHGARVKAFVPAGRLTDDGEIAPARQRSLIGHDFLQKTGAKLDYSRQHSQVFSGLPEVPTPLKHERVTAAERRALRRLKPCRRRH